tara:strand:- start:37064 stop:37270 length:207 start_codon:yes stop_codon:yes gene_type:complete
MDTENLIQNLLNQFNGQNDTIKPKCDEKYNYRLTEGEFDVIIDTIKLSKKLKDFVGDANVNMIKDFIK